MKPLSTLALLASLPFLSPWAAEAVTTSTNTGTLGATANGTNSNSVIPGTPGAVAAGGDQSVGYPGTGGNTTIPFIAALNPSAGSPFSIEFWANPSASDNDDAIVSNRFTAGANRSGWIFFQRAAATGWNFRMYNGVGSGLGWDLTGGTSTLNGWSHVVATWNGTSALLYVNGVLADNSNEVGATGVYAPNVLANAPTFSIGANADLSSATSSLADEVAFYNSALSLGQVQNHFNLASSPTAGTYYAAVLGDGATLQLSNAPEPSSVLFLGLGGLALLRRRARA